MSLVDKPFKEAIRGLPTKKLSWWADRRIKKMLRYRAAELDGKTIWADFFKQLVAVPMALVVLFTAVGSYGYASPSVVKGDLLYFVKTTIENARYPQDGSSEERIAYHLWLSERRYDEANEILSRLGKAPLVFIPVARAIETTGSGDDVLNQILLETLQNATQQVDYAFLISDEIRDVERVKTVKEQIRTSLEKQKQFVKQVTPVLKEVKLQQKKKARVKRSKPVPVLEAPAPETTDEVSSDNSSLIQDPVQTSDTSLVSEDVQVDVENDQIDQNVQLDVLETSSEPMVVQDEDDEVEDVGGFLEDRVNFQDTLLQQIDEVVAQANTSGMTVVRLSVFVKPLRDEHEEISNEFFRRALSVHYEMSKKILESELQEFVVEAEVVPEPVLQDEEDMQEAPVETEDSSVVLVGEDSSEDSDSSSSDVVVEDSTSIALTEDVVPELPLSESVPDEEAAIDEPVPPLESEVIAVTEVVTKPEMVSTLSPVSDTSLMVSTEATEPEPVKTACEMKAEEICTGSDRSDCVEDAVEECEEEEKERLDREREQERIRNMHEEVRKELQEIDLKMEQLKLNLRNSSPQLGNISDEMKASILKQEKDRKEEEKRKDETRKKEEDLKKVEERKNSEEQKNTSEKKNQEGAQKR